MKTQIAPVTTVTTTGPLAGADVSALIGDYTLNIRVAAFSATSTTTPAARITIESSTTGGFSSGVVTEVVTDFVGQVAAGDIKRLYRRFEIPLSKCGQAGALFRVNVIYLTPPGSALTLESWIDS